jgi:uncharacterized membrane protein
MTLKLSELEQLKLTNPVSKKWMHTAIRHCQKHEDFDIDTDDGEEPDRYEGEAMADALNAFPALISWAKRARPWIQKAYSQKEKEREVIEDLYGVEEPYLSGLAEEIAELEQLLGEVEP